MRKVTALLAAFGFVLASGCSNKIETDAPAAAGGSDVLARYHFVGTRQLASDTNATKLREVLALPETHRLVEQTLVKLAHAPLTFYGNRLSAAQDERGVALVRPLLDDLLREESVFQVRGPADKSAEWTLLVHLPADRLKSWSLTLAELAKLWQVGTPEQKTVEGFAAWEIKRPEAPGSIVWTEAGSWFALGVGPSSLPTATDALRKIKTSGRPVANAANHWLETAADLPRLQKAVSLAPSVKWPSVALSVIGTGENLRSTMRIAFSEPMTGPLNPWRVPTNIIREPLLSFTAMRGVAPLLGTCPTVSKLQIRPAPNELFVWAQDRSAYQTFWCWPAKDTTNTLKRIADAAPSLFSPMMQKRGPAQIIWMPTNTQVFWQALPAITPFLNRAEDVGLEFICGGLFPPMRSTNPPPPDLLAQFVTRTNLLYYDWEITQGRLSQWHLLSQLFAIVADAPQLSTNFAGLPWLLSIGPRLGNSVTEVTVGSPKDWSLTRKSHIGLTGIELVTLVRWLESTNFPRLSFDLPRPARQSVRPAGAPNP